MFAREGHPADAPSNSEISRGPGYREFTLHRGGGGESETLANDLHLEVGVVSQDFSLVHAASEHPEHSRNRDAQTPDTGQTPIWFGFTVMRSK